MRPSIMFYLCRIKKPLKKRKKRKKAIPKVQRFEVTVRWRGIERADFNIFYDNKIQELEGKSISQLRAAWDLITPSDRPHYILRFSCLVIFFFLKKS